MSPAPDSHRVNETDPLWYYAAVRHAPHTESTRKRGWVDGFVACLELLASEDDDAAVLLGTIRPEAYEYLA